MCTDQYQNQAVQSTFVLGHARLRQIRWQAATAAAYSTQDVNKGKCGCWWARRVVVMYPLAYTAAEEEKKIRVVGLSTLRYGITGTSL